MMGRLLLLLLLLPVAGSAAPTDDNAFRQEWLERNGRYRNAREAYRKGAQRYNSHVMASGSAMGAEAKQLQQDMDALRRRSEQMRGELQALGLPKPTTAHMRSPKALPVSPELLKAVSSRQARKRWWVIVPMVVGSLILIYYALGETAKIRRKKAKVRCPGCGQVLKVPKSGKRLRFRCPKCKREAAYNPKK
jgi:transposase